MRDIKFRAYEENGNNMINSDEVGDHTLNDLEDLPYILMQYTGLKDKNGKEIYEGDIICNVVRGTIYEIVFSESSFCLKN